MEDRCSLVRLLFLLFFVGFLTSSVTRARADDQRKTDEHRNKKKDPDVQSRRFAMKQKAPHARCHYKLPLVLTYRALRLPYQTWQQICIRITDILKRLKHFYNKQEPPSKDHPTEVKLGIYVNSFYSINEQTMDYSMSMYLRQSWNDKRLAFESYNTRLKHIRMGENSWAEIWVPDTFFRNEKGANFHEVTVNNRMLRLSSDGNLWYVTKISATLSCPMNLQKYPLDTQSCPMMFESFGYTMDTMFFTWLDNPVDIEQGLQLPQFTLEETIRYECSQNYTAGAFPCLELQFVLRRDIGFFLIQVYVPSILIVILSWVSFWINVDASPARVSIGLLTVLTTTTMSAGARSTLPRVSYIKAIDVWMIICLLFVFTSLIEYAVVNVLSRKTAKPPPQHARRKPPNTLSLSENNACHRQIPVQQMNQEHRNGPLPGTAAREAIRGSPPMHGHGLPLQGTLPPLQGPLPQAAAPQPPTLETIDGRYQARRIDKLSRKFFPLAFLLFNIIYWIVYTMPSTVKKET